MKISVVTSCFNCEKTIDRTIKSVIAQDYPDLEYILIDGGSTDGTMEV
jgi:glycosyltransferase involved in cell wall biosynthesis